jgi:hypothetical protein
MDRAQLFKQRDLRAFQAHNHCVEAHDHGPLHTLFVAQAPDLGQDALVLASKKIKVWLSQFRFTSPADGGSDGARTRDL